MRSAHEYQDMEGSARLCPCCGVQLPVGLFAHEVHVPLPDAVARMTEAGHPIEYYSGKDIIFTQGRWFLACVLTLPLDWDESPLRARVWLETEERYALRASTLLAGEKGALEASGILACDIPAFLGSAGARASVRLDEDLDCLRLKYCSDRRLRDFRGYGGHDGFVRLYRRMWGGSGDVVSAHLELRASCADAWREAIGRPSFRQVVEPPPPFAGIRPAELLIAPPEDTGGTLIAATLGNAEANPYEATEISIEVRDPANVFLDSFGELCYWSRTTSRALRPGQILNEAMGAIAGTNGMTGWLLVDTKAKAVMGEVSVRLLLAQPLHTQEIAYARRYGYKALLEVLEDEGTDLKNLGREALDL